MKSKFLITSLLVLGIIGLLLSANAINIEPQKKVEKGETAKLNQHISIHLNVFKML